MNQASLLAAFTLPPTNAAPATATFVNLIGLMLSAPNQDAIPLAGTNTPLTKPTVTASQIADAMIRSMLASVPGNSTPANGVADAATTTDAGPAAAAPEVPNLALPVPSPSIADAAPDGNPNVPVTAPPKKQSPNAPVAVSVPNPLVLLSTPTPVIVSTTSSTPPLAAPAQNSTPNAPALPADPQPQAPPLAMGPRNAADTKVAFTAVLTPKDNPDIAAAAPTAPEASASQAALPPAQAVGPWNPPAENAIATVSNPPQPPSTPSSAPQNAIPAIAPQAGDGKQQSSDSSSQQQQQNLADTPQRPVETSSDPKIKAAAEDDHAMQTAAAATAMTHDHSAPISSFAAADSARAEAAPASDSASSVTPYHATADALRTTESNLAAEPPLRTGAAQEIAIRIAPPDAPAVDLRVVERAGQVHVDVRTADAVMQSSLRQELGTLTSTLERAGYHTETFTPASALGRAAASAQAGNQDTQQDPSQNRGGSGDFSGERRQPQPQKRPGTWLEEFEEQP